MKRRDVELPAMTALPKGTAPRVSLEEVCESRIVMRNPRLDAAQPFTYIDITSIDNSLKQIVAPRALLGSQAPSRARQIIRTGDVLVATTRPGLNAVASVPADLDGQICSTGFAVLRPGASLDSDYLFLYVQSESFVEALKALVRGALYPAVTERQVRSQRIPLPPLPEQRRIAAMLKEQLAEVALARKAVEEQGEFLRALPAALLRRAFGG